MSSKIVPGTMRAILYNQSTRTLSLVSSHPVPVPNLEEDEHLLEVHSMAITKGELTWPLSEDAYNDYSPGVEMSGTVVVSPPGSRFPPGSDVYMRTTFPRPASAREYTIGLGKELAFRPHSYTAEQAASVPVSALTAWQTLFVQAGLSPTLLNFKSDASTEKSKKILVIGASGSAGLWTTQLARAAGLWVAGTSHTRNIAITEEFGAHEVMDYTETSLRQWLEATKLLGKFDFVVDCVGGQHAVAAWHAANSDHGLLIRIVAPEDGPFKWVLDRPAGISDKVTGRFFIMDSSGEQLQKITDLIDTGRLKTAVDTVFELEDFQKAFDRVESGKTTGKVVIRVHQD